MVGGDGDQSIDNGTPVHGNVIHRISAASGMGIGQCCIVLSPHKQGVRPKAWALENISCSYDSTTILPYSSKPHQPTGRTRRPYSWRVCHVSWSESRRHAEAARQLETQGLAPLMHSLSKPGGEQSGPRLQQPTQGPRWATYMQSTSYCVWSSREAIDPSSLLPSWVWQGRCRLVLCACEACTHVHHCMVAHAMPICHHAYNPTKGLPWNNFAMLRREYQKECPGRDSPPLVAASTGVKQGYSPGEQLVEGL